MTKTFRMISSFQLSLSVALGLAVLGGAPAFAQEPVETITNEDIAALPINQVSTFSEMSAEGESARELQEGDTSEFMLSAADREIWSKFIRSQFSFNPQAKVVITSNKLKFAYQGGKWEYAETPDYVISMGR